MPKLFIPACGDRIVLTKSWKFSLHLEHRNVKFAVARGDWGGKHAWSVYEDAPSGQRRQRRQLKRLPVTLPKGTVLECDRVYIRGFNKARVQEDEDYDSVTWKVVVNGKPKASQRFWAKLRECCEISYKLEPNSFYRDRIKAVKAVQES